MKEIIKLFYNNSDKGQCFYETPTSLFLTINCFIVLINLSSQLDAKKDIELTEEEEEDLRFQHIDDINDFIGQNSTSEISEIKISLFEYLGYREDVLKFDSDNEGFTVTDRPKSFSKTLYKTIKELYKIIPSLKINYRFEIQISDSTLFCNAKPDYIASILINQQDLSIKDVNLLISILKSIKEDELDKFYWSTYFNNEGLKNSFEPQFLNTNTKVRRLGYLKIFFKMIAEKKKISASSLNNKFEEYAVKYNNYLKESVYSKGLIQPLNGKSAAPYIELLKEFKLIETINRLITPSKKLKVFLELSKKFDDNSDPDPFLLNELDRLFFLELILKCDFLYSSIILEMLYLNEDSDIKYLVETFQAKILKRLSDFLYQNSEDFDKKKVNKIKKIKRRIEEWKKANVYLEHIIMPRINWLADLGLIHLSSDNKISMSKEGNRLVKQLFSWIDINSKFVENSTNYLKSFYPHIAGLTFRNTIGQYPNIDVINNKIECYIQEGFLLFKTLAPNRITSSQAFTFIKYMFYFNDGFCVTERYLERIIQKKFSKKYIYKFQQQYDDGYIQKLENI